jgi:hypothetical protein
MQLFHMKGLCCQPSFSYKQDMGFLDNRNLLQIIGCCIWS